MKLATMISAHYIDLEIKNNVLEQRYGWISNSPAELSLTRLAEMSTSLILSILLRTRDYNAL